MPVIPTSSGMATFGGDGRTALLVDDVDAHALNGHGGRRR